jgi:hypothetical protein
MYYVLTLLKQTMVLQGLMHNSSHKKILPETNVVHILSVLTDIFH